MTSDHRKMQPRPGIIALATIAILLSTCKAAKNPAGYSEIEAVTESEVNAQALAVAKSVMAKQANKNAVAAVVLSFNAAERHFELQKELKFKFYGVRDFPGYWGDVIKKFSSETAAYEAWLNGEVDCTDCYMRGKDICVTKWTPELNRRWVIDVKKNRIPVLDLDGTTPLKRSQLLVRKYKGIPREIAELPSVYITEQKMLGERDSESNIVYKELFLNDITGKRWRWLVPAR